MVQVETNLVVADNSGAPKVRLFRLRRIVPLDFDVERTSSCAPSKHAIPNGNQKSK
jgi:ribosomal protein L14